MDSKYIFAALALGCLVAGLLRLFVDHGRLQPQSQGWLLLAIGLSITSAWLFYQS